MTGKINNIATPIKADKKLARMTYKGFRGQISETVHSNGETVGSSRVGERAPEEEPYPKSAEIAILAGAERLAGDSGRQTHG